MIDLYSKINELQRLGQDAVLVTVTEKEGNGPADVGKKMLVDEKGTSFGTVGGGSIELYAIKRARQAFIERKSFSEKYVLEDKEVKLLDEEVQLNMACGGKATLFYEFIGPKQYIYIFGGGHCGAALARSLKPLGFHVTIIDSRKEVLDSLDDSANSKVLSPFADYIEQNGLRERSYVVVCTPSHINDYDVLDKILEKKIKLDFFGMLCSKKKVSEYLDKARQKFGENLNLENFYAPIGLNIGGPSPEEIAISITAEILSIYYQKDKINAHLRDK